VGHKLPVTPDGLVIFVGLKREEGVKPLSKAASLKSALYAIIFLPSLVHSLKTIELV